METNQLQKNICFFKSSHIEIDLFSQTAMEKVWSADGCYYWKKLQRRRQEVAGGTINHLWHE